MTLGVGSIGGAVAMFILGPKQTEKAKKWNERGGYGLGDGEELQHADDGPNQQCYNTYQEQATARSG